MTKSVDFKALEKYLKSILPFIDELMSIKQISLTSRPAFAVIEFSLLCKAIVDGVTVTKENAVSFLERPLFIRLIKVTKKWYSDRYGKAMKIKDVTASGVVLIYDSPFEVVVPLVLQGVDVPGESIWVLFPSTIQDKENVLDWIAEEPDFKSMPRKTMATVKKNVALVANNIRIIHNNIRNANTKSNNQEILKSAIKSHINRAARDILDMKEETVMNSYWEMHSAVEKILKLLIHQRGSPPPMIHDLNKLCALANSLNGSKMDCNLLSLLPTAHEAINLRQGDASSKRVQHAVDNYLLALNIIVQYSKAFNCKDIIMHNTRFFLKIPAWAK